MFLVGLLGLHDSCSTELAGVSEVKFIMAFYFQSVKWVLLVVSPLPDKDKS